MNRKLAVALLGLGCIASVATSQETPVMVSEPVFPDTADRCDDPYPAICVTTLDAAGEEIVLDSIEIQDADHALVKDIACSDSICCSYDLDSGSYVVVVERDGEVLAEPVVVDNSHACDHEVTELTLQFGQAE
mgnify:CR=1 FL=1